ncbi:hypothetical protein A6A04_13485 [Paramagnetospirillum marisnigri]|uniref:Phage tail protein n=1 Tax=Paramagnetospirillum marisnigri TaxID=1285242 RepID=A0A178MUT1_9PROT|nr:hypothetical protein [Paramagnetospirillum marisnigri]OAN53899.1 hypothetical protein A6A04_13485 [Paramagnetospirillum marisnigri]
MTIPAWPATLPQALQISGYSEAPPDVAIASQPDIGVAKLRRRSSNGPRPVRGNMTLTSAQVDTLLDFYEADLMGGTLRFSWRKPRDPLTSAEYRFVTRPEPQGGDGVFSVTLDLEMLP